MNHMFSCHNYGGRLVDQRSMSMTIKSYYSFIRILSNTNFFLIIVSDQWSGKWNGEWYERTRIKPVVNPNFFHPSRKWCCALYTGCIHFPALSLNTGTWHQMAADLERWKNWNKLTNGASAMQHHLDLKVGMDHRPMPSHHSCEWYAVA